MTEKNLDFDIKKKIEFELNEDIYVYFYDIFYLDAFESFKKTNSKEFEELDLETRKKLLEDSSFLIYLTLNKNFRLLDHIFSKYKNEICKSGLYSEENNLCFATITMIKKSNKNRVEINRYVPLYTLLRFSSTNVSKKIISIGLENRLINSSNLTQILVSASKPSLIKYIFKKDKEYKGVKFLDDFVEGFKDLNPIFENREDLIRLLDLFLEKIEKCKIRDLNNDTKEVIRHKILSHNLLNSIFALELEDKYLFEYFERLLKIFQGFDIDINNFYKEVVDHHNITQSTRSSISSVSNYKNTFLRAKNLQKIIDKFDLEKVDTKIVTQNSVSVDDTLVLLSAFKFKRNKGIEEVVKDWLMSAKRSNYILKRITENFELIATKLPFIAKIIARDDELRRAFAPELKKILNNKKKRVF